ncbi:hypothetical protein SNE40_011164 [Patella caerulea]|uniref:Tubulin polyglutamylase TTLL7 n=1 Tax=Patella caerulea TaxID=87958 RepID=A0AAN8PL62_PATCE
MTMRQSTSLSSLSSVDKDYSAQSHYTRNNLLSGQWQSKVPERNINRNVLVSEEYVNDRQDRVIGKSDRSAGQKKKKKKHLITANLSGTRYDVVRQMVEKLGFSVTKDDDLGAYLIWNDSFVSMDRISELKSYQRMNHFPGMGEITRKDALARNLLRLQKAFPDDYNFIPKTWILPTDHSLLLGYARDLKAKKKQRTFIAKPSNGAQGHGIALYKNAEKIPQTEHFIVQEYIDKPLLLDGYKFDLRVYVLVTSCDPLRIFLLNDGLVRLCTEKYVPPSDGNVGRLFMHLTNYSVNKHSETYEKSIGVDTGSKRSIKYLNDHLRKNDYDVTLLWKNISEMIVKTMLVAEPHILHAYRMCRPGQSPASDSVCFEVLGFDFMIDRKCRPWLIEINRSPSFGTDEKIDYDIKSSLIEDTLHLLNIKVSDKRRNLANMKAEAQKRLFRTTKKGDTADMTELEKRRHNIAKRKEELKEQLNRVRKATAREDYENRNLGRFRRIFPSDDKIRQEKYCNLLMTAFSVILSGRGAAMQKEILQTYNNRLQEEDITDQIEQCEVDEKEGRIFTSQGRPPRIPKPLTSMPDNLPVTAEQCQDDDDDSDDQTESFNKRILSGGSRSRPQSIHQRSNSESPPANKSAGATGRPASNTSLQRTKSLTRIPAGNKTASSQRTGIDENILSSMVKEREEELTKKTLTALNEMRIKFPGKSDAEADNLLDRLHENMKFHKPRIASYWLVKLDSIKRRKVIDIVRSNVRAVIQRIWKCSDIDSLRLFRIFSRVFNRLLWSHGQGLWNCFASVGNSWETIFSKSSECISENEMNSCRRIVQLCKDCLLIVYQFATEAKAAPSQPTSDTEEQSPITYNGYSYLPSREAKPPPTWNPQTFSQRYSKLYQSKVEGMT